MVPPKLALYLLQRYKHLNKVDAAVRLQGAPSATPGTWPRASTRYELAAITRAEHYFQLLHDPRHQAFFRWSGRRADSNLHSVSVNRPFLMLLGKSSR